MDFKEFIQRIENKIGEEITRQGWTATLLSITERRQKAIKILVRFSTNGFSFEEEIKLAEVHFTEETKFRDEILRRLKRLKDYSDAINDFQNIQVPNITNRWKGYISEVNIISPIEAVLTVTFAKTASGELWEIPVRSNVYVQGFIDKKHYESVIAQQVDLLNEPINITYYKNLISL